MFFLVVFTKIAAIAKTHIGGFSPIQKMQLQGSLYPHFKTRNYRSQPIAEFTKTQLQICRCYSCRVQAACVSSAIENAAIDQTSIQLRFQGLQLCFRNAAIALVFCSAFLSHSKRRRERREEILLHCCMPRVQYQIRTQTHLKIHIQRCCGILQKRLLFATKLF